MKHAKRTIRRMVVWALLAAGGLAQAPPESLSWRGIVLRHEAEALPAALEVLRELPVAVEAVRAVSGLEVPRGTRVWLLRDGERLRDAVAALGGGELPTWVGGVAFGRQRLVILRLDLHGSERPASVLRHELSHIALAAAEEEAGFEAPRWFDEGLAQLVEGQPMRRVVPSLGARAFFGGLHDLGALEGSFPRLEGASALAYSQSESFVRHLRDQCGPVGLPRLLRRVKEGVSLETAVRELSGAGLARQEQVWRAALRNDPVWVLETLGPLLFAGFLAGVSLYGLRRHRRRRRRELARLEEIDRWRERLGGPRYWEPVERDPEP